MVDCEIVIVVDSSGSMASIKTAMEDGMNKFLDDQKALPGTCNVTLVTFDSGPNSEARINEVYVSKPINNVPPFSLSPDGGTPLFDALGKTLTATEERLVPRNTGTIVDYAAQPGKTLFIVITDGEENTSREFTRAQIKTLVERVTTEHGWEFSYLGANVDAFKEAATTGISVGTSSGYVANAAGVTSMLRSVSYSTASYRSTGMYGFSDDQRTAMGGTKLDSSLVNPVVSSAGPVTVGEGEEDPDRI